ncbi:MAG TPA: universal stress protein [Acidimicrobiales bacterium]|nr:universal stress protein [Acidimicrobiales bacterium]
MSTTPDDLPTPPDADAELDGRIVVGVDDSEQAAAALRWALAEGADMLVVGSHGRSGLSRLMLGSVAMACVNHAPCPVVVIRTPHEG